jgi:uncharacterized protein (DUF1697 family)
MTRYVAFLRGVNVGGVTLKMAEVAATFSTAGFDAVSTVLASGNVVFSSPFDAEAVRATAESALRARFGYEAWVLVYDVAALRSIVEGFPFEPEVSGQHSYVTFVSDPVALDELAALAGDDRVARGEGVLYWQVAKSDTLDSPIGKTMGKRRYKSSTTTRNLRTLHKVLRG